jgi:hypothetical protein
MPVTGAAKAGDPSAPDVSIHTVCFEQHTQPVNVANELSELHGLAVYVDGTHFAAVERDNGDRLRPGVDTQQLVSAGLVA